MKKRLLITSIVMMLVVAVALSTATYAWFTQNATVTANQVVMTASTANAQSISIAWLGSETKSTTLSAQAGSSLDPMCPTAAPVTGTTNANTIAFNGQFVDVNGNFVGAGQAKNPYVWQSSDTPAVTEFYVNNDSNSQAVSISVTAAIANSAAITPLASGTLLESGKVYYKKVGDTWTQLVADSTANWEEGKYVANVTTATGDSGDFVAYATKGVEEYVRVAIFASEAKTQAEGLAITTGSPLALTAYDYKGMISKTPGNNVTYGAITGTVSETPQAASSLQKAASTGSVTVISTLPAEKRVYVRVLVWLDGADFTAHEGNQAANVTLTFSAGTAA